MSAPRPLADLAGPAGPAGPADDSSAEEFLAAVQSLVDRVGGRLVDADGRRDDDEPLRWRGAVVAAVRLPRVPGSDGGDAAGGTGTGGQLGDADADGGGLTGILAGVERQFDGPLAELSRPDKQRAVRLLEEAGAFSYRKAVETVAGALGVSRFTVYNYLNRERA